MKFILQTNILISCVGLACLLAACDSETTTDQSVAEAALALSLEANEDGSDSSAAAPLETEPVLLNGCGIDLAEKYLRKTFDEDDDGKLGTEEREALREDFGGELAPAPLFSGRPPHGEGGAPGTTPPGQFRGKMRHHRMELLARIYDADDSGSLDENERQVLSADLDARCENRTKILLEEFDADEDGELDITEWKLAHEAIRERFEAHHAAFVAEFDLDENGELDDQERENAAIALRERLDERRASDLANFDLDGDGSLSDEERIALVLELRARVRGEYFEETPSEPDAP